MYYEEKVLAGVFYYRTSPYAEWEIMSPKQLTQKLLHAQEAERVAQARLDHLTEAVAEYLERA